MNSGNKSIWVIGIFLVSCFLSITETEGRRLRAGIHRHVHGQLKKYSNTYHEEYQEDFDQDQPYDIRHAGKPQGRGLFPTITWTKPILSVGSNGLTVNPEGVAGVIQNLNTAGQVLGSIGPATGPFAGLVSVIVNGLVKVVELVRNVVKWAIDLNEQREDRAGFIKGILYKIEYVTESLCNIMVFNLRKQYIQMFQTIIDYQEVKHEDGTPIGVWVADAGVFYNLEWIFKDDVWKFAGNYYVQGSMVNFNHLPCEAMR